MKTRFSSLCCCSRCCAAAAPALRRRHQARRSAARRAKSGSPRTTPSPSSPSTSRCRPARPMTRRARPGLAAFAGVHDRRRRGRASTPRPSTTRWPTAPSSSRASAERDYLVISIATLSENAPEAMHLLQLALTHPRFDADAVDAGARPDAPEPAAGRGRAAAGRGARASCAAFFSGHPYAPSHRRRRRQPRRRSPPAICATSPAAIG